MQPTRASNRSPLENSIGFSRAVRAGSMVFVAGTASLDEDGKTKHPKDPYLQTQRCIEIAEASLHKVGAELQHVVRTRIMLKDMSHWKAAARAHGEAFGEIRPACTFVEVSRFIEPDWLVELEMDAVISP